MPKVNELPTVKTVKYIVNPKAGSGKMSRRLKKFLEDKKSDIIYTTSPVDAENITGDLCCADPFSHIIVCGGDGSLSEAAGGILKAGAGQTAVLSGIPCGDGNDFIRAMSGFECNAPTPIDVIAVNGRYCLNIVNIGFDCSVVAQTDKLQMLPAINGSFSYILGILATLAVKKPFCTSVTFDHDETVDGEFLLVAIANCPYYGGGIMASPTASPFDDTLDVIMVKNLTRARFISLFNYYKTGTHFNDGEVVDKLKRYLTFRRCKTVELCGIKQCCVDGEVIPSSGVRADILKGAIRWQNIEY